MELEERLKETAGQYFKQGYNCAEAVLRAGNDCLQLGITDDMMKVATGFGGGMGHAGCVCGALTGACMILSLMEGRETHNRDKAPAYRATGDFHEKFSKHFGATCCRALNSNDFGTIEQRRNCLKITTEAAALLALAPAIQTRVVK